MSFVTGERPEPVFDPDDDEIVDLRSTPPQRIALRSPQRPVDLVASPLPEATQEQRGLERVVVDLMHRIPPDSGVVFGVASVLASHRAVGPAVAVSRLLARHLGEDVLVVEADLRRRGRLASFVGQPDRPGLIDVLAHPDEPGPRMGHRVERGLYAVGSGVDRQETVFLPARPLAEVVSRMRASYRVSVVIPPPLDACGDGDLATSLCDALVLIVDQDKTRRAVLADAVARVGPTKFVGAVVVVPSTRSRWWRRGKERQ